FTDHSMTWGYATHNAAKYGGLVKRRYISGHPAPALLALIAVVALCAVFASLAAFRARAADDTKTINLTIASSHSTRIAWVGALHTVVVPESNKRLEAMGSPYRIRWTEAYGGSLYKYGDTLEAIEIGLTDMGWVGTLWELSKMPLQNVTYYVPFTTDDYHMIYEIMNELHATMPAMADAWTAQNQKFL